LVIKKTCGEILGLNFVLIRVVASTEPRQLRATLDSPTIVWISLHLQWSG
jgi:hypothetical protein